MVLSAHMHGFQPFFAPGMPGSFAALFSLFALALLWEIVLKGFALWYAARGNQKWWFVAILVLNTFGILPIVYLIWFRPTPKAEVVSTPPAVDPSGSPQA
jgi:hypothetical protein